jgi:hypothetical protein
MRIQALAILLTASTAAAFPVSAHAAEQDGAPLPQFMSSTARAELAQRVQDTKPVPDETRQAAEVLSDRFAGSVTEPNPNAGVSKPDRAAPVVLDARDDPEGQAHVAVLMAPSPSTVPDIKRSKNNRTTLKKPAKAAATAARPKQAKVKVEPVQAPLAQRSNTYGEPQNFASNAVPGADAGWRTGFIGLFTNPAFWH